MSKPRYNVGDLVAADNDEPEPKPIIGWITSIHLSQTELRPIYSVDWADGENDRYTEDTIARYKRLYRKLKRRK